MGFFGLFGSKPDAGQQKKTAPKLAAAGKAGQPAARAPSRAPSLTPEKDQGNKLASSVIKAAAPKPSANSLVIVDEVRQLASYTDVPNFQAILTDGETPIFKLTTAQRGELIVLELTGRRAQMIVSSDRPTDSALQESVRGVVMAGRYKLMPMLSAATSLITELYSSQVSTAAASGPARSTNQHIALITEWVEYALENDATDIHLETLGSTGIARFRVHGEVENMRSSDNKIVGRYAASTVINGMGTLYNLLQQKKSSGGSQFEADKNLYCMIPFTEIPGHTLKLRYQSVKGNEGPKVVMRLLHINENQKTLSFKSLGYEDSHCTMLGVAMGTPSGAVLISGVTGSGKSTTQKSFVELNPKAPSSAIYTIEDPVEYPIRYAHQIPIQRDLSNPAESARMYNETVSAMMRLDPDIGMLGEIRDRYSAMAIQQLIESGHMGLGTVHAHLLSGIIPRLTNPEIGLNREVLTSPNMLTLLVYQALVPKLCPYCAHDSEQALQLDPAIGVILKDINALDLPEPEFRWKNPMGCQHCKRRGTVGLTVVAEMMMPDDDWLRLIRSNRDTEAVAHYRSASDRSLQSANMNGKTVFEHTLYKSMQGAVDARQCGRFDVWARYMKSAEKAGMVKGVAA